MRRGEIWWADLPAPRGSEPGFRRPVLIIQADSLNESRIRTLLVVVITSNLRLARMAGNVLLSERVSKLSKDSVVNVTQVLTLDRSYLVDRIGHLPDRAMKSVEAGLRLVLEL